MNPARPPSADASRAHAFLTGLVFGFDVGTGSLGWAVRNGDRFLDVGVLICPEDTNDLSGRRGLRRQRRTLRSRKYRRLWFARELAGLLGLTLAKTNKGEELPIAESAWNQNERGGWVPKPGFESLLEPVALRNRALTGKPLKAEELHAALAHLFKRRGYSKVPWAAADSVAGDTKPKKGDNNEGDVLKAIEGIRKEMVVRGCHYPCQLLAARAREQALWRAAASQAQERQRPFADVLAELWVAEKMHGEPPKEQPLQRRIYWPREALLKEFAAACRKQAGRFPRLAEKSTRKRLLFGKQWDEVSKSGLRAVIRDGRKHYVYFKDVEGREPGVLGLRWPRFDNRSPGLDVITPENEQGQPQHAARKKCDEYQEAQWAMALINFRVQHPKSRKKFAPPAESLAKLRDIWEAQQAMNAKRKRKKTAGDADEETSLTVSEAVLKRWADNFKDQFALIEGQRALTPRSGAGRARFNKPNLIKIKEQIERGEGLPNMQPLLRREGETNDEALNRFLAEIKHPTVRHRLVLFRRLLHELIHGTKTKPGYGQPDVIVVELARKFGMSENAKRKHKAWQDTNQENNDAARVFWEEQDNHTPRKESIQRYKLWIEAGKRCPYCLGDIIKPNDPLAEIEHVIPKSRAVCNEIYNLTLAHRTCNNYKGERTPHEAFHSNPAGWPVSWREIEENARVCFARVFHFNWKQKQKIGGREVEKSKSEKVVNSKTKLDLFLSDNAVELLERKSELVQSQYLAKLLRQVSLLILDKPGDRWLSDDGRDPTDENGDHPSRGFLVSNGQITSLLRRAWGLNPILHPYPPKEAFQHLPPDDQEAKWAEVEEQIREKNRGDLRHHALDAMVIACTLPWLAHRTHGATDEFGNHGWWTQDEKQRSKAANPIFPQEGALRRVAEEWMKKPIVRHHVSKSRRTAGYETTIYGQAKQTVVENGVKRRIPVPDVYLARKELAKMTVANFRDVHPEDFGAYLAEAWQHFAAQTPNLPELLKKTKDKLPESFIARLCFSHFQAWREAVIRETAVPPWPDSVKISIRSVKLVAPANDSTVVPFAPGTKGFVKRATFREVRIHPSADGKGFVPVFVPYWKGDKLIGIENALPASSPVAVLRKRDVIQTVKPLPTGHPPGHYCLYELGQVQPYLLPPHVAKKEEAIVSFGIKKSGIKPRWADLIRAMGYELPHPPPAQPSSAGPDQAGPVAR